MKSVDLAINDLIKNLWKAKKAYNEKGKDTLIYILAQVKEDIDTLIHHLNKGGK